MWALVSPQANASLGTWEAKYDLTIPSLETPSTWVLDSKVKREITMGLTCCYRKELVNYVQEENSRKLIESRLKEKQKRLRYTLYEPYSEEELYTFVALQLLDIYTTHNALKYNCVREVNPVLGDSPTVAKMFAVKTLVLIPAIEADLKNERLTRKTMRQVNGIMFMVIANNNLVGNRAKRNCLKL